MNPLDGVDSIVFTGVLLAKVVISADLFKSHTYVIAISAFISPLSYAIIIGFINGLMDFLIKNVATPS